MPQIIFIHGTGGRLQSYDSALGMIRKQAARYMPGFDVHSCLWGEPHGAKLNLKAASIPTYQDTPPNSFSQEQADAVDQATWRMLAEDSIFELRLLQSLPVPRRELGPRDTPPGRLSIQLLQNLQPQRTFVELLEEKELHRFWHAAHQSFAENPEVNQILTSANRDTREISQSLSRALVSSLISVAATSGHPGISSETRSRLVDQLIPLLGGQALGTFDWITKPLIGIAKKIGTYKARRERRALTDEASPAAGDIVLYQARGEKIRKFIADRIHKVHAETQEKIIIIAHSLGGIAAVDLLAEKDFSSVVGGLVTVGSQVPFLYEIGALCKIPLGESLPDHFPKKWLNFWDPNDFLSYIGAGVFGHQAVTDQMVRSRLPFPDSHSAYWDQEDVWTGIRTFFP